MAIASPVRIDERLREVALEALRGPEVAEDIDRSVHYAERYFAVCPERFIIKIPLTPEGYCAVARVRAKDIPVNYTLGFGARQNYLAAILSKPTYCNVFLGRLNQVI